jgi:hypothetical protein
MGRSRTPNAGGRRRASGVALFGVALLLGTAGLLAACGSPANSSGGPVSGTSPIASAAPVGDAAARLTDALVQLASGYSFGSTVSVGGQVATQANGRWIGGGSEFTVTTNGVSITYRTLPPRSWVLQAGAGWVEVNGTVPSGDPLDALKAPGQTTIVAQTNDMLELSASYPAAILGLAGNGQVAVDLVLAADGSLKATYTASTGNASSATTIKPDPSQDPIVVPSPS